MSKAPPTPAAEAEVGRFKTAGPEETGELGRVLGGLLLAGDVVGLVGDLGAGKTCLTQGIARGLKIDPRYRVASPTFTLINEYPGRVPLFHLDLYRLAGVEQMEEVGVLDALGGPQACVVEWFDRLEEATPADYLRVDLQALDDAERMLIVYARGERHTDLAARWLKTESTEQRR